MDIIDKLKSFDLLEMEVKRLKEEYFVLISQDMKFNELKEIRIKLRKIEDAINRLKHFK